MHMFQCCPEFVQQHTDSDLRRIYCNLASDRCMVKGHEEWKAEKRAAIKKRKEEKRSIPKWNRYDNRLQGGVYDRTVPDGLDQGARMALSVALEKKFDEYPDAPYGVQAAMGSKRDWIHWGLRLASMPSRTRVVLEEYQKDIQLHIDLLDALGAQTEEGYQGTFDYVRALHCIFQDAFRRCHLPAPPRLNLYAMEIRDDGADTKSRMRSFRGYKFRAFGIIQVVNDHPMELIEEEETHPVIPATKRREYPNVSRTRYNYY